MCGERSLKVFIEETFQLICGLRKKTFAKSNLVVRAKNVKLTEIFSPPNIFHFLLFCFSLRRRIKKVRNKSINFCR